MIIPTLLALLASSFKDAPLTSGETIEIAGSTGRFDYLISDPEKNRIYAAHAQAGAISVLSLDNKKITEVKTPKCNGIIVDPAANLILAAGSDHKLVAIDRDTLEVKGTLDLSGPGDAMTYDSKRHLVYLDEDDGTHVWVIDAKLLKIVNTIDIKGAPEWVQYNPVDDRVYQNIKSDDMMQVIDAESQKVVSDWKFEDCKLPHGMALDTEAGKAFSAGKNGKLILIDLKTGKAEGEAKIATGVDQIAYDSELHLVYCAGGGFISVVKFEDGKLTDMGQVKSQVGVHTLAVDPKTHDVWVAYGDEKQSFLASFKASTMKTHSK